MELIYVLEVTEEYVGSQSKYVHSVAFISEDEAIRYLESNHYVRYGAGYKEQGDNGRYVEITELDIHKSTL